MSEHFIILSAKRENACFLQRARSVLKRAGARGISVENEGNECVARVSAFHLPEAVSEFERLLDEAGVRI